MPAAVLSVFVTEKKGGSAACHHKSQTCEADVGAIENRFYSVAWENGGLLSQRPSPLSAMEKVQLSSARTRQKSMFLLHFKVQSCGACRGLLSGLSPHPGSLAYS